MKISKRPYLVVPKLIEQPTWGGRYILDYKNWTTKGYLNTKKIGQSYELFGQSKLLININDSTDPRFIGELGRAEDLKILNKTFYSHGHDYIYLADLLPGPMPLLIKFTQAAGNSFQLHVSPSIKDSYWRAKPESWYFFENGLVSLGIKFGASLDSYKKVCLLVEKKMIELSQAIKSASLSYEDGKKQAGLFIKEVDPWQYVNIHEVKKNSLLDLSRGGLHHSWEEDRERFPLGNVLYEVQLDVMDPVSTLRSFDQGKIGLDGTIRKINVEDYFKYLDTNPLHNDIANLIKKPEGNCLLKTKDYGLDLITVTEKVGLSTGSSFAHLFVKEGDVRIVSKDGFVRLTKGHACFLPQYVGEYEIISHQPKSVILKTFV